MMQLTLLTMDDALTVAGLLIKAGYTVRMQRHKDGTARYVYALIVQGG